jgi:hypothetical protein
MLVLFAALIFSGCGGPFLLLPGGRLAGAEAPLDLSLVPSGAAVLQLETNANGPYSVNLGFRQIAGQIYIDPDPERRWYQHIQADPNVRIRFGGEDAVHPVLAEVVTDSELLTQFTPDRIVIRLVPRSGKSDERKK